MKKQIFLLLSVLVLSFAVGLLPCAAQGDAYVKFDTDEVVLKEGSVTMSGHFTNSGDSGVTVVNAKLDVTINDDDGVLIWYDEGEFENLSVYVPVDEPVYFSFTFENDDCPDYDGVIHWSVNNIIAWQ